MVDWYERAILGKTLNQAAHSDEPTFLVFDEVQNLTSWAPQLKFLIDHAETTMLVTGSSALAIESGRDSLAGRITTLEAGALSVTEIASFHNIELGKPYLHDNGLEVLKTSEFWTGLARHGKEKRDERDAAFQLFARRGGFPLAHRAASISWPLIADQLNENVIRRVIRIDLQHVGDDNPQLLEEVFRLACRYAGQSPGITLFTREIHRALGSDIDSDRVHNTLRLLIESLLVRAIPPLELRLKKTGGHPKLCLSDHSLRASWLQEPVPIAPADLQRQPEQTSLAGHLAESIVGAGLSTVPGLDLAHLPARGSDPEVDFVLTVGDQRIPIEVKYQRRIDPMRDTEDLRTFLEASVNRAPFGLLVTQTDNAKVPDPRIIAMPLASMLLIR